MLKFEKDSAPPERAIYIVNISTDITLLRSEIHLNVHEKRKIKRLSQM